MKRSKRVVITITCHIENEKRKYDMKRAIAWTPSIKGEKIEVLTKFKVGQYDPA